MNYYVCPNAGDRRCSNNYALTSDYCSLCGSPSKPHGAPGLYYCSSWVDDCDDKNTYTSVGPCDCGHRRVPSKGMYGMSTLS